MYFKKEYLRYKKSIDLADTFKFDELPEKGFSAGMILTIESPTYGGQHYDIARDGDKFRMIDWITKVQIVVDGKRPLKDLNGPVAQALEFWNTGKTAPDALRDRSLGLDRCFIPIAWGQKIGDPLYFLNWEDYSSVELDVTNVFTNPPHASATITIENLKIMDPPAGLVSKGVFQERIWREWTTVQNKTEYFKPPAGNPYRRIILRSVPALTAADPYRRKRGFYHLMEEIKLAFKSYEEIAFDGYGKELMEQNTFEFPHEAKTSGVFLGSAVGTPIRTGIGHRRAGVVTKGEVATSLTEINYGIYTYLDDMMVVFIDAGVNPYCFWKCEGLGYNNTMALLFDHLGPENYLDSVAKAPINLDIKTEDHADAVGGTNQIILSELVKK